MGPGAVRVVHLGGPVVITRFHPGEARAQNPALAPLLALKLPAQFRQVGHLEGGLGRLRLVVVEERVVKAVERPHVVALQLDRLAEVAGVIAILEGVHFGASLALRSGRSSRLLSVGGAGGLSALRRLGRLSYGHRYPHFRVDVEARGGARRQR